MAYFLPVFADEAYYYIWSLRPQLSYFDHPPLVSWLIYVSRTIFPTGSPFEIRSLFIIASFFTSLIWIKILQKKCFSNFAIESFLILIMLNPLLGAGSVIATPDVPLILFWSISYLAFIGIFESKSLQKIYLNYAVLGIGLGLGFCSKYHIVLFVMSGLIYLFFNQAYKKLKVSGIFITLILGFIFSLPVIIWNYQNDWASFNYQLKHGFGKIHYDWRWTLNFYLSQIALVGPIIFLSLFEKRKEKINQIFSISQFAFFTTSSFKAIVEANWPITAHLHTTAHFSETATSRRFKFIWIYWVIIYVLMVVFFNLPVGKKALRNQYRDSQINDLVPLVIKYQPLYGPSYQISSLLSWKSNQFIPKLNGLSRFDFYDTLPESNPIDKRIFVLKHFDSIWPKKYDTYQKIKIESFENLQIELYQLDHD